MFGSKINKRELLTHINSMSEEDFARFLYCQEMAGTYLAIGQFESNLISAMRMCDHIKVEKALSQDLDAWDRLINKSTLLERSTIGSLIAILERHDINADDIAYLRWLKDKRDYFIHRLFHEHMWPGDLNEEECLFMRRRLLAIQLWLERSQRNIWLIFERAGFVELCRLPDGGFLAVNLGVFDEKPDKATDKANGASE